MRRLMGYLAPYKGTVALSVVCLLVHAVMQVVGPLLTKVAVDRYLAPTGASSMPLLDRYLPAESMAGLAFISLLYLISIVGSLLVEFAEQYLMNWTGQRAMFDLRRQLMEQLQRLDVSYFDRTPVGRLVTRVTSDVDALNDLFASGVVTILGGRGGAAADHRRRCSN